MTKPLSRLKILQGAVGIYLVVYVVLGTLLDDPLLFSKMTPKRLDEALHKFNEPYGPSNITWYLDVQLVFFGDDKSETLDRLFMVQTSKAT